MDRRQPDQPHVLFLFSDTGGGHRSAAEAIIEAIELEYSGRITTEMVDFFRQYAPPPLDRAPELYPPLSRHTDVWKLGYNLLDGPRRARVINSVLWPYYQRASRRLLWEHPSDLIVSVHPIANGPVLRTLGPKHPPFITVVTDLVTTHAFWYHRLADLVLVPTEQARQRGLRYGLTTRSLRVVGLPVARRFCHPAGDRDGLRQKLGWPLDKPVVLLIGGGEGMGPLESVAEAVDAAGLDVMLAVVTGRNRAVKARLEGRRWRVPATIYGFVREMPDLMRAADVLVTKAGPGTISEAFIAGLPMILYARLPGQEEGNVHYVVSEGAGVWAPEPEQVVGALKDWLAHPQKYQAASRACLRLARPEAALEIARIIAQVVGVEDRA